MNTFSPTFVSLTANMEYGLIFACLFSPSDTVTADDVGDFTALYREHCEVKHSYCFGNYIPCAPVKQ
jgi:hypothetical protein